MSQHSSSVSFTSHHLSTKAQRQLNVTGKNPFGDEEGRNPFGSSSSSSPSSPAQKPKQGHQRVASTGGINPFGTASSLNPFGSSSSLNPFGSASSSNRMSDSSSLESLNVRSSTVTPGNGNLKQSMESLSSDLMSSRGGNIAKSMSLDSYQSTGEHSMNGSISRASIDSPYSARPESPVLLHRDRHQANMTSILNDPVRRKRNYDADLFTRTWGSYFVPSQVPPSKILPSSVPPDKFIPYLKYLRDPFKTYRSKEREMASISRARQKSGENVDIDAVFLNPNFQLQNPETFEYVLPRSQFESQVEIQRNSTSVRNAGLPQRSTKLLQEKLSHSLDKVEMRLGEQVDGKSHKFFETIRSQERLNDDANQIRNDIMDLRAQLSSVDASMNKQALHILQLHRLRRNYRACHEKLVLMATVKQAQPTIQLLLSQSDFVGALDLITTTQEVLHDELNGIKSFRHLDVQLCEMERMIYNMIQDDFVKFTLSTLTLDEKTFSEIEDDTDRMICVLFGLLRRKNVNFLQTYKTEANTMMKAKIKQIIAEQLCDVNFDGDLKLDDQIRSLSPTKAVILIEHVFEGITLLLNKMDTTNKLIKCVITSAANKDVPENLMEAFSDHAKATLKSQIDPDTASLLSEPDFNRLISESDDVLMTSCELAQSQCIKILTLRQQHDKASNERLDQNNHFKLSRQVEAFAHTCERLTKRPANQIRASLVTQSRELVRQFHSERLTNMRLLLENERWTVADVPADFQRMVSNIVRNCSPSEVVARPAASNGSEPPKTTLLFNGKQYVVTSTLLLVIKIVVDYCQCVIDVPIMSKDILTKTVESLKQFNENTCHLVLMAGAIRNIGLKTITAKHLGVASQTLSVVLELLPWIRGIFLNQLPKNQHLLLDQLNNLETDIQDHINQIFSKLINIMGDVYKSHLTSWQPKPPTPSSSITTVTRQTIKLHEALVTILQPAEIQTVFKGVFCLFRKYFEEQLTKHGLMNIGSNPKKHGIVGAELSYFIDSVNFLEFVGDTDDIFHDIGTR